MTHLHCIYSMCEKDRDSAPKRVLTPGPQAHQPVPRAQVLTELYLQMQTRTFHVVSLQKTALHHCIPIRPLNYSIILNSTEIGCKGLTMPGRKEKQECHLKSLS